MKAFITAASLLAGVFSFSLFCQADPPPHVIPPPPDDPRAYQPIPMPKPLPMDPPPQAPGVPTPNPSIRNEDAFIQAYTAHHNPRIMVFVNRTVTGELKDGSEEVIRVDVKQSTSGAVDVNSQSTSTGNGQSTSSGYAGSSATNTQTNDTNSSSFKTQGPADYSKSTSVKVAQDKYDNVGASNADYEMIEASLVKYFDNSGKVQITDAEAVRGKLDREKVLRLENGDPAAVRLIDTEFHQDILIRVSATPSSHTAQGVGIRILAKAISTPDGRSLGTAFVDMPLPMSKQNINVYTRYLAGELMGEMTKKWMMGGVASTVEVRIYKAAGAEDAIKIKKWLQATRGVSQVDTIAATSGSTTGYASFRVGYMGAPEDLYSDLKDALGASAGLKAVDVSNTTINLEMTGQLNLVTTTRKVETTTTVTEEKKIEPINAAPPVAPAPPTAPDAPPPPPPQ